MDKETFDALCRQKLSIYSGKAFEIVEPSVDFEWNWHIDCVCDHLEAVESGDIRRLIINIPPRTLKTFIASVAFPSWCFARNPSVKFMLTSFKFDLAKSMTRKTRLIMNSDWYKSIAPNVEFARDKNEVHHFETSKMGQYYAGAMSSVTGTGSEIQICDDPLNPMEAVSDVQRLNAIETIRGTLFSRFNDPRTGRFILIMQRLHAEDPTGDLLKDDGWTHLSLPAIHEPKTIIDFGGKKWEYGDDGLLFPDRLSKEVLEEKQQELGPYAFAGQYLQSPVPLGGGEFKKDFINYYASQSFDASKANLYIVVDPATSKKKTSDYTCMVVWALGRDQNYYIVDGLRERLDPSERIDRVFELHRKWTEKTKKPPKVGWEEYGMMSDIHYIEKKQKEENYRFPLIKLAGRIQKEERIRRLIPPMARGQVWLPNDLYYKDHKGLPRNFMSDILEQEMFLFPVAPHDDFIDAMSRIFDMNPIFPSIGNVERASGTEWGYDNMSVLDL